MKLMRKKFTKKKLNRYILEEIKQEEIFYSKNGEWKLKPLHVVLPILKERTIFRYSKSYPKLDKFYLYNENKGIYTDYTGDELLVILGEIFVQANLIFNSVHTMESLMKSIKFFLNAETGYPEPEEQYLVFTNGMLNLSDDTFGPWPRY